MTLKTVITKRHQLHHGAQPSEDYYILRKAQNYTSRVKAYSDVDELYNYWSYKFLNMKEDRILFLISTPLPYR